MKFIFIFFGLLFITNIGQAFAQTEIFDVAKFTPPKDWKREAGNDKTTFSIEDQAGAKFCYIMLYKSRPSSGNLEQDFSDEWRQRIAAPLKTETKPEKIVKDVKDSWDLRFGAAKIEFEAVQMLTYLIVFRRDERIFSIVTILNSDVYHDQYVKFLDSLKLDNSTNSGKLMKSTESTVKNSSESLIGTWKDVGAGGFAEIGPGGYTGATRGGNALNYVFKSDGTYVYQAYFDGVIGGITIFIYETGNYQVNGSILKILPKKQLYRKNGVDSWWTPNENRTYQWSFIKDSGITQLILKTGGSETFKLRRDG